MVNSSYQRRTCYRASIVAVNLQTGLVSTSSRRRVSWCSFAVLSAIGGPSWWGRRCCECVKFLLAYRRCFDLIHRRRIRRRRSPFSYVPIGDGPSFNSNNKTS